MKKIKYFKKMNQDGGIWYAEGWGYPLDVELTNGKTLHLACEFCRGAGWILTDRDTGLLAQHTDIPNRKQLSEYIPAVAPNYSRIIDTEYYKAQKDKFKQFFEKMNKGVKENEIQN